MVFQRKIKCFILVSAACAVGVSTQEISEGFCNNIKDKSECYPQNNNDVAYSNRNFENFLRYSSIVFGILGAVQDDQVGVTCAKDANSIIDGVRKRKTWAMRVLDASGNKDAGFVIGNAHWFGSKTACDAIGQGFKITLSNRFKQNMVSDLLATNAPLPLQYRMVYVEHSSPWQVDLSFAAERVISIGVCLPSSCSNKDVRTMAQNYFQNSTASRQLESLDLNGNVVQVKDLKLREGFIYKRSVALFFLVTVVFVTLAGIAYMIDKHQEETEKSIKISSSTKRIVSHFFPKRNLASIYDTSSTSSAFPVIFGIKSISCIVILISHTQLFGFYSVKHKAQAYRLSEEFVHQWITNGIVLVDVFFVVSAFLMSHKFFGNKQQMEQIRKDGVGENVKRFGRMVLQRYLRLVPLYLITTLIFEIVGSYVADTSSFYIPDQPIINCQRYWWRDLLFIQLFFNFDEMCAQWSWSLVCELQYYALFLIVLFIYAKNKRAGLRIFFSLAAAMFVITLYLTVAHKFMLKWDVIFATNPILYTNPLTRAAPYFMGIAGGWIYTMFKDKPLPVSKTNLQRLIIVSILFLLLPFISIGGRELDYPISSTILVIGRWIYATSVISVILASLFGHQGNLTRFLSARFFIHISKLEYAIFLLNPLVTIVLADVPDTGLSLDTQAVLVRTCVVAVVTYALAVVYTTLFEMPLRKVFSEVFSK